MVPGAVSGVLLRDAQRLELPLREALCENLEVFLSARRVGQVGCGHDAEQCVDRIDATFAVAILGDALAKHGGEAFEFSARFGASR